VEWTLNDALRASPIALVAAVAADLLAGDPVYRFHPVRIIGNLLAFLERLLRRAGADGYVGGVALFVVLALLVVGPLLLLNGAIAHTSSVFRWLFQIFLVYSFLALGDLIRHVWRIEKALVRDDLASARTVVGNLVGRDVERLDAAACRRAAIESLGENLTDGFTSPVFWYMIAGLPGLALFKVVSTMDSMVGYKTARYLRFGWCGARLDDAMNYVPARLTWLLITVAAAFVPTCSAVKAFSTGLAQHAVLPGPNSGWSEAATAGAIQRRLVGPIWINSRLVTDAWIGVATDPPASSHEDVVRALTVVTATGLAATAAAVGILASAT
jgi:adenosylcobinamide-phosphate synthase